MVDGPMEKSSVNRVSKKIMYFYFSNSPPAPLGKIETKKLNFQTIIKKSLCKRIIRIKKWLLRFAPTPLHSPRTSSGHITQHMRFAPAVALPYFAPLRSAKHRIYKTLCDILKNSFFKDFIKGGVKNKSKKSYGLFEKNRYIKISFNL